MRTLMRNKFLSLLCVGVVLFESQDAMAADDARVTKDVEYARVGDTRLMLDLYAPANARQPKLIVWVHGGAWRSGSRSDNPLKPLVDEGYAVASVDYRLTSVAPFPAQVHDIKAAIRYLRANQEK